MTKKIKKVEKSRKLVIEVRSTSGDKVVDESSLLQAMRVIEPAFKVGLTAGQVSFAREHKCSQCGSFRMVSLQARWYFAS